MSYFQYTTQAQAPAFYHVMLDLPFGTTEEQVKAKMDLAIDWYKYANTNWIVYSSQPADVLMARFAPLLVNQFTKNKTGYVVILKLDVTGHQGWFNKGLWDWLGKPRPWGELDKV